MTPSTFTLRRRALPPAGAALALAVAACGGGRQSSADSAGAGAAGRDTIVVYNAGSLARPLRAALDSFAATRPRPLIAQQENAGSLETARKLTDLHKIPDVIALADHEVFPQLLMPDQTTWYVEFARNRMVIAYTPESKDAARITAQNWWQVLQQRGVETGRANPALDPNGYRTLLVLQLAEKYYRQPGLYRRLLAHMPQRDVRPKESDLVGLLQAGELDYIWSYESIAQAANLRYVQLPPQIDLSDPADSALYASVSVRVPGKTPKDTVEFRGSPIVYGLSIPKAAPHDTTAREFVAWLLSDAGRRVLRSARLDPLDPPVMVGTGADLSIVARTSAPRTQP